MAERGLATRSCVGDARGSRRRARREAAGGLCELDLYGIKELQVLEELLRKNRSRKDRELIAEVARRIRTKIGWSGQEGWTDWQFLNAFYGAQRGRLERKMLFGKRQKKKRP